MLLFSSSVRCWCGYAGHTLATLSVLLSACFRGIRVFRGMLLKVTPEKKAVSAEYNHFIRVFGVFRVKLFPSVRY